VFLSLKEIGKIDSKSVAFFRVERPGITINGKLNSGLDPDGAIHSEQTGAEKYLIHSTAEHLKILPLKRAGSLPGELSKDAPIPSGVIGAPRQRPVAVNGGVGKQVGAAVAFRFGIPLIARPHPDVPAARGNARHYAEEVTRPVAETPIYACFLLRAGNERSRNGGTFDTLSSKILLLESPPHQPAEIATDRRVGCDR
jgi:hypothetical protein